MDESTLNDLLECSVCLERLDTSSKVLPCQHTFCKKCLEEIVERHKELRCPECRILVPIKVDDLPPNVLLMRILEGMRNATPKTQHRHVKAPQVVQQTTPVHISTGHESKVNQHKHNSPLHPVQPYAKALYDYISSTPGDLSFKRGEIITLKKRIDSNWYQGECGGNQGVFPLCYVQVITPVPSHTPQCKALYDFRMANDEEEGCLTFSKGDVISVIRRVDENWAEGKLNGRIGIFPLAFVELNSLARSLMKLSTNAQPGPSKVAPPTPTTDDSVPLIPTDHSNNLTNITLTQQRTALPASDSSSTVSSGSSTTPNVSSSSSTAASSPASPPPRNQPATPRGVPNPKPEMRFNSNTPQNSAAVPPRTDSRPNHQNNREKRHSLTSLTLPTHNNGSHRHSAEILSSEAEGQSDPNRRSGEKQQPVAYVALYPYKPQKPDELELRKGGIYFITERCLDGWYKGTSNRTQKCGVFPGNYVVPARGVPLKSADDKTNSRSRGGGSSHLAPSTAPPELPPRSQSPNVVVPSANVQLVAMGSKTTDKSRASKDKSTVSLMRRLASMKRSKSPPPPSYSMDNPVFEDTATIPSPVSTVHPVHVRSGSCPSQLLQVQPTDNTHRIFTSASQRIKHKERPSVLNTHARAGENSTVAASASNPDVHTHKKSNSLDAGNRQKTATQTVRERYRCIAPYPPNSEYELELQVNDIIYVHKKREDGWYKGTQQRTGRTGLFPASFVENI